MIRVTTMKPLLIDLTRHGEIGQLTSHEIAEAP